MTASPPEFAEGITAELRRWRLRLDDEATGLEQMPGQLVGSQIRGEPRGAARMIASTNWFGDEFARSGPSRLGIAFLSAAAQQPQTSRGTNGCGVWATYPGMPEPSIQQTIIRAFRHVRTLLTCGK